MKGILLASPSSGAGKTLVTLSLLRALKDRGIALAPAKAGPDYIDPAFHQAACGAASFNLDGWAMRPDLLHALVADMTRGGKMLVVEAMMGLFDGAADGSGSAAELARMLGLPVLLVVDCARLSHSVAPLVHGFESYWPDISLAGLVLNKVGSVRHEKMLRDALAPLAIPVIGVLRRNDALLLPERHLGLVQASEHKQLENFIDRAARNIAAALDLQQLLQISNRAGKDSRTARNRAETTETKTGAPFFIPSPRLTPLPPVSSPLALPSLAPPPLASLGKHIAVARDDAFRFAYPHILAGWRKCGAAISFFSPLADEAPASDADAVYLPGGYPELYAGKLAAALRFKQAMRQAAQQGHVIYGECGGYMVLGQALEDGQGEVHEMLALLPLVTSFKKPQLHLGYRRLALAAPSLSGLSGHFLRPELLSHTFFRGHEFHYATSLWQGEAAPLFRMGDASGNDLGHAGLCKGSVAGSFIHVIDVEDAGCFE